MGNDLDLTLYEGRPKIAKAIYDKERGIQEKLTNEHPDGIEDGDLIKCKGFGEMEDRMLFFCCLKPYESDEHTEQVSDNILKFHIC